MKEKSMWKIYLDASERNNKIVRLLRDGETISEKTGDIDLVSTIKTLLDENRLDINDIEIVESNLGPGSFTGLKISSTIANTLNWALKRKDLSNLQYPDYGREPNITLKKDL